MVQSPSQLAADLKSDDDSPIAPLGTVTIGNNSGTMVVSLPKRVAEGEGFEPGEKMQVGYHATEEAFVFVDAEEFDGW